MRTSTDLPLTVLTTLTVVPNGRLVCAAVKVLGLKVSPLAVRLPYNPGPYQLACPQEAWAHIGNRERVIARTFRIMVSRIGIWHQLLQVAVGVRGSSPVNAPPNPAVGVSHVIFNCFTSGFHPIFNESPLGLSRHVLELG